MLSSTAYEPKQGILILLHATNEGTDKQVHQCCLIDFFFSCSPKSITVYNIHMSGMNFLLFCSFVCFVALHPSQQLWS